MPDVLFAGAFPNDSTWHWVLPGPKTKAKRDLNVWSGRTPEVTGSVDSGLPAVRQPLQKRQSETSTSVEDATSSFIRAMCHDLVDALEEDGLQEAFERLCRLRDHYGRLAALDSPEHLDTTRVVSGRLVARNRRPVIVDSGE